MACEHRTCKLKIGNNGRCTAFNVPDITAQNEGSIFILRGVTDAGREWIEENCQEGDFNPFGTGARLVERRYVDAILDGAGHDGLRVEVR